MAQRRLDGSYNQIQTEINQVDSREGKHQIATNDNACIQQVIDQIQQREIGGIPIVDENNLGGLFGHRSVNHCSTAVMGRHRSLIDLAIPFG